MDEDLGGDARAVRAERAKHPRLGDAEGQPDGEAHVEGECGAVSWRIW
jgi:hypothetical protein